jgi:transposase
MQVLVPLLYNAISVAMEQWTVEHRMFAYDAYVKNAESITAVQRLFRVHFNLGRHGIVPSRNTILRWVDNLRTTGSIVKKKPPGPTKTARTPDNIERVREALTRSPRRSARRHARELNLSRESVRTILKKDLAFHPYKMCIVQQLKATDYEQREDFAVRMQVLLEEHENSIIIMSDEAHFHLNGEVNKQNFRYWSTDNPCNIHEKPLHTERVTVWCAIGNFGIIGPYFFENEHGATVTVNAERYIHMLNNFLRPQLRRRRLHNVEHVYFQQDGATPHTARVSMDVVRRMFPGRVISRFGDIPWPPRSPDLSSCDFFLWGYLKSCVYAHKPRTLADLKEAIKQEVAAIDREMLDRTHTSFLQRLEMCIKGSGHHLSDIIFHS